MTDLNIAICEDEPKDIEHLKSLLATEKITFHISTFSSAEELLSIYQPGAYDLLFIDVYMKGITGVDAIQKIRELDSRITIVLISSSTEFAMDAYRLRVARYLEKPARASDFHDILSLCLLEKQSQPYFHFIQDYKDQSLPIEDILFIEQQGRKLLIHRKNQPDISINGKLDQLEWQFVNQPFFRCHKSYYVNLSHVSLLENELRVFIMDNGASVYIRRDSFSKAKKAYEEFLFHNVQRR